MLLNSNNNKLMLLLQLLIINIIIILIDSFPSSQSYCSLFDIKESGVAGYFTITIDENTGLSYYDFNLDLTSYYKSNPNTCNLSNGLKYHIHSFWTNNTATSSNSCSTCGGHFDPYLACSSSSQYQNSPITYPGPLCKAINRATPNYTYPCTTTSFSEEGNLQSCEVGDLSGKFGLVYNSSVSPLIFKSSSLFSDPLGPSNYTYGGVDISQQIVTEYTSVWSSIVFHCNDPPANTKLFCSQLLISNVESCVALGATLSPTTNQNSSKNKSCWFEIGVTVVVCIIVFLAILLIIKYGYQKNHNNNIDKSMSDPLINH